MPIYTKKPSSAKATEGQGVKIYTKKGDRGKTRTFYGEMSKSDVLAEALGAIDELNSYIGVCRYQLINTKFEYLSSKQIRKSNFQISNINIELRRIQGNLLTIGSCMAGSKKRLRDGEIKRLEKLIDKLTKELPPLKNFIYPVGEMQVARAVARRCERRVVQFTSLPVNQLRNKNIIKYLNRLSDALFTVARWVNFKKGLEEEVWGK